MLLETDSATSVVLQQSHQVVTQRIFRLRHIIIVITMKARCHLILHAAKYGPGSLRHGTVSREHIEEPTVTTLHYYMSLDTENQTHHEHLHITNP